MNSKNYEAIAKITEMFNRAVDEAYQLSVKEGREGAVTTVDELEEKPKTVKRIAEVGERFIITKPTMTFGDYEKGDVFTVLELFGDGIAAKELREELGESGEPYIYHSEYEVIIEDETVEHEGLLLRKVKRESQTGDFVKYFGPKFDGNTQIGKLYEVFDTDQYSDDQGAKMGVYDWLRAKPKLEIFEVVDGPPQSNKNEVAVTNNWRRHETIQRAKAFVKSYLNADGLIINHDFYDNPRISFFRKDNKITCVITPENTMLDRFVGRSFCSKGDVFNEWIGKAIALCKALEIDIPEEFMHAVQPTEFAIGQRFKYNSDKVYEVSSIEGNKALVDNTDRYAMLMDFKGYKIIDDTNAEYDYGE